MEPKPARSVRQVAVADHLWEAFERLAAALGSDRDALVNEAMHLFARHHGYAGSPLAEETGRAAEAGRVLEAADALERAARDGATPVAGPEEAGAGPSLYLLAENGDLGEVRKARFLIGRGKHCDFVIDSPRVSREHAAIVRAGEEFWIEDLGSSNGTWFDRQRIERRRVGDGDEYFISSEKIRCVIR